MFRPWVVVRDRSSGIAEGYAPLPAAGHAIGDWNISAIADTENVETEDPATSIENLAMGADGTGENVQSSDENYTIPTPTLPVSLGVGPAPALSFDDIEAGADRFVSVLRARGIWGAREYSEKCHHDVISSPSWAQADKCAAFDYAAAAIDDSVSGQGHFAVDNYFRFQAENQEQSYTAAGAPAYFLSGRLASIKRAAISTATTKLSELLADEQRQRNLAASRQASQADSPALTQNSD